MSQQVSTRVANCERRYQIIHAAIREHGPEILPVLERLFALGGEFDMSIFLNRSGDVLKELTSALHDADITLARESADDPLVSSQRTKCVMIVRAELIDVTSLVRGAYGDDVVTRFGLAGVTPRAPLVLANAAEKSIELIGDHADKVEPKPGRMPLDFQVLADGLQGKLTELHDAINAYRQSERRYELALENRDALFEEWFSTYSAVASIASALFALAGRKDLAARVRPASRNRLSTRVDDGAEAEELPPPPEGSTDAAPAETPA